MHAPYFQTVLILGFLFASNFVQAQNHPIQVGIAKIDITPSEPIRLTGYANRTEESQGVDQQLWAKAIAFGSDADGPSLLITVDVLGIPGYMGDDLAGVLKKEYPIDRKNISICATHTHSAPAFGGVASLIFSELPAAHFGRIAAYTSFIQEQLEAVAKQALENREPALLSWNIGKADFAMNRRVLKDGRWENFGAVPDGPVDHDLPVMKITDLNGNLKALWINYACHCTTLKGDYNKIHGDWAGAACVNLETDHPGTTALISIGCGADSDPQPRGKMEHVLQHGKTISDEVDRLLAEPMTALSHAPSAQYSLVDLPFAHVPARAELQDRGEKSNWTDIYAKKNLELLIDGKDIPVSISYPIQTWTFGEDLAIVFLAGEVVVDYALRLKSNLDRNRVWLNAYANDAPCYIASRRIIREGGYEAESSMHYYNKPSPFQPVVEDRIVYKVLELLGEPFLKDE